MSHAGAAEPTPFVGLSLALGSQQAGDRVHRLTLGGVDDHGRGYA